MEQGYENVYDKIKELEEKVKELEEEAEYVEKKQQLDKIIEEMNEKDIFYDLKFGFGYEFSSLSDYLKIDYYSSYYFSVAFYEKYANIWDYLKELDSTEETLENINTLGHLIYDNNKHFSEEYKKEHPIRDITKLPYYVYHDDIVYAEATICLRLENMGFRDTMKLVQECRDRKEQIETIKSEIEEYKKELRSAIFNGIIDKTSFVVNKTIKPTMDNVVKPVINKGIKSLIRSLTTPVQKDDKK